MAKLLIFYKKYWVIILLAFIATSLLLIKIFLVQENINPAQNEDPIQTETFKGIVPGKSEIGDLNKLLGAPDPKQSDFTNNTLSYTREGGGPNHQVITDGEKTVLLFKERTLSGNLKKYIDKYGVPEGEYYGDNASVGYKVYAWPKSGFAVEASLNDGLIFEIWYFAPTTLENFKTTWGKDLSVEFPEKE